MPKQPFEMAWLADQRFRPVDRALAALIRGNRRNGLRVWREGIDNREILIRGEAVTLVIRPVRGGDNAA